MRQAFPKRFQSPRATSPQKNTQVTASAAAAAAASAVTAAAIAANTAGPTTKNDDIDAFPENSTFPAHELVNVDELLRDFSWKGCDAAALETKLQVELLALESANIHALIESSLQSKAVCSQIDLALVKLEELDTWVSAFISEMSSIANQVNYIEDQNRLLHTKYKNQDALLLALDKVFSSLSLPPDVEHSLMEIDLVNASSDTIKTVVKAADYLRQSMQTHHDEDLKHMLVVNEKAGKLAHLSSEFGHRVLEVCVEILAKSGINIQEDRERVSSPQSGLPLFLQGYSSRNAAIAKFRPLIAWLLCVEPKIYATVLNQYVVHVGAAYRADLKDLLSCVKASIPPKYVEDQEGFFAGPHDRVFYQQLWHTGGSLSLPLAAQGATNFITSAFSNQQGSTESVHYLNFLAESFSCKPLFTKPQRSEALQVPHFGSAFCQAIVLIYLTVQHEQNFVTALFGMGECIYNDSKINYDPNLDEIWHLHVKEVKTLNLEQTRELVSSIFHNLDNDIAEILDLGLKDSSFSLAILNVIEKLVHGCLSNQNYILDILSFIQNKLRAAWTRFILTQIRSIQMFHGLKKKAGILPFVKGVPCFLDFLDKTLDSPPNSIVSLYENGVEQVMNTVIECIVSFTDDEGLMLENAYFLYHLIKDNKEPIMKVHISKVKALLDEILFEFFKYLMRKGFSKLFDFFTTVESLVITQTPEEIIYQASYNKAAAKRVLSQYGQKEVAKCFEYCHKKINKILFDSFVIKNIWDLLFDEFVKLHGTILEIIKTVYNNEMEIEYSFEGVRNLHSSF